MGIYSIVNKTNGKQYIGSSTNIEKRWRNHVSSLNRKDHHCTHLQNAWNLTGPEHFEFLVLEYVHDESLLCKIEQDYLDTSDKSLLYNTLLNASPYGYKIFKKPIVRLSGYRRVPHSQETKDKISKSNTGKKASIETKLKLSKARKGIDPFTAEHRMLGLLKAKESNSKPYPSFISPTVEIYPAGNNLSEFCKEHNNEKYLTQFYDLISGRVSHCKGWQIYGNHSMISLKDPCGIIVNRSRVFLYVKEFGLSAACLYDVLKGKIKCHKGWTLNT